MQVREGILYVILRLSRRRRWRKPSRFAHLQILFISVRQDNTVVGISPAVVCGSRLCGGSDAEREDERQSREDGYLGHERLHYGSLPGGQDKEPKNSVPSIKHRKAHAHVRVAVKLTSPSKQDDVSGLLTRVTCYTRNVTKDVGAGSPPREAAAQA